MQASLAVLAGIAVAVVLLAATRRRGDASGESTSRSASTGWLAIALGLAAMAALFMAMKEIFDPGYLVSIVCAFASVALGIGALRRQERSWQAWV
ncbi:MAG: hypothetical protein JXA36_03520, partial [Coriobacteriia bacterium]|nr:hypothetical protein [Coriobacteriia bacterium]